jgi:hypothetical protein
MDWVAFFMPAFVLGFAAGGVAYVRYARIYPGVMVAIAAGGATALGEVGLVWLVWHGYRDTGTEPLRTLDKAVPALIGATALWGTVILCLWRRPTELVASIGTRSEPGPHLGEQADDPVAGCRLCGATFRDLDDALAHADQVHVDRTREEAAIELHRF